MNIARYVLYAHNFMEVLVSILYFKGRQFQF